MKFEAKFTESPTPLKPSFKALQVVDNYDQGYEAGHEDGYGEGQTAGYDVGYAAGNEEGKEAGYSDGYTNGINRTNLYHKSGKVASAQSGLTIEYNEETQTYTLNGTASTGSLIQLSNNMDIDWEIGNKYCLARFLTEGEIVLEDSTYLLWSIFTMNNSGFMNGRVTEKAENVNTKVLYALGTAIAPANNDGFRMYIQILGSGKATFNNVKVRFLLVPQADGVEPWVPYIWPANKEASMDSYNRGYEAGHEEGYDEGYEAAEDISNALLEGTLTTYRNTKLTKIRSQAFYMYTSLTDVSIPNVTTIGSGAFGNCSNLANVELSNELEVIDNSAFYLCSKLAITELPKSLTKIGSQAFYMCSNVALTELPSGVTSIGDSAFYGCSNLTLTSLPSGLSGLSSGTFQNCTNLALTELPDGIQGIGNNAFQSCSNITLTALPSALTYIGSNVFQSCSKISIKEIPSKVSNIGNYAFRYCTGLTEITFKGRPSSIGSTAFSGCTNLLTINVPWSKGAVANAPWGATKAAINYDYTGG